MAAAQDCFGHDEDDIREGDDGQENIEGGLDADECPDSETCCALVISLRSSIV